MKKRTILFYSIFILVVVLVTMILSAILANVLFLVYSPTPQEILTLTPEIMKDRVINNYAVNQMFWIIVACFGILLLASKFKRWFGLKDYKSKTYKVTDEIEIPMKIGDKQTQSGSSWWLSSKKFSGVFDINTVDPENPTIKKLLHNADEETKAIKKIQVSYKKDKNNNPIVDEEELKKEINKHYSTINKISIPEGETKVFQKGGIVLGRRERRVLQRTNSFPFLKARKVEDIYFIGDDVHTLTVGATRSRKNKM